MKTCTGHQGLGFWLEQGGMVEKGDALQNPHPKFPLKMGTLQLAQT